MEENNFEQEHNIHLERLSTQTLKLLLKENLTSDDDILSVEAIQTILAILREREGEIEIDIDSAWKQLQENICTLATQEERISKLSALAPEPEKPPMDKPEIEKLPVNKPSPPQKRSATRRVAHTIRRSAIAAVLVIVLLAGSVTAQAFGIDILGLLTTWTDEHFYLMGTGDKGPRNNKERETWENIKTVLQLYQIPPDIVPRRYPNGYIAGEPKYTERKNDYLLSIPFYNEKDEYFCIRIGYYESEEYAAGFTYEKDPGPPEEYIQNDMVFYLMKNSDTVTGVWVEGHYRVLITGPISMQELKNVIDSIGGV